MKNEFLLAFFPGISRCLEHVENTWLCLVWHLQTKLCTTREAQQTRGWLRKAQAHSGALNGEKKENNGTSMCEQYKFARQSWIAKGTCYVFWLWESMM